MKIGRYVCILIVALIMIMLVISESSRSVIIGYQIAKLEEELKVGLEVSKKLAYKSATLKTPYMIALKVKDMELDLVIAGSEEEFAVVSNQHKQLNNNPDWKTIVAQNLMNFRKSTQFE